VAAENARYLIQEMREELSSCPALSPGSLPYVQLTGVNRLDATAADADAV
jgi:hypothetical protein